MPSYEELVANERALREILADGAEEELRSIPGVVHVSVGLKERGRKVTREPSFRIYVQDKRPMHSLPPGERIPSRIHGIATDVIPVGGNYDFAGDTTRHRPLLGGIAISNGIIPDVAWLDEPLYGTLCCIATLVEDGSPVLLTCAHVLLAGGGKKHGHVYQPQPALGHYAPFDATHLPVSPIDDEYAIGEIIDASYTSKVDVGIARIDVSSWCRCCGIDTRDEINGISAEVSPGVFKPLTNGIVGQRVAVDDMKVFKVGQRTGRTAGRVVTADYGPETIRGRVFTGQIEIESVDPTKRFSRKGDSGSAVIDEDGYIVGMVFAQNDLDPPEGRTLANHIAPVCAEVGITINFTPANTTAGARVAALSGLPVPTGAGAEAHRQVRERLLRDAAGAHLFALADAHRAEIVRLVTERRPVTVAWHRAHGPAFFATAVNTLRAGGTALPREIEGLSVHDALERMGVVLAAHGSPELRRAIMTYGPPLLEATLDSATLDDVIQRLNGSAFAAGQELAGSRQ
jgi:hypothetical protein